MGVGAPSRLVTLVRKTVGGTENWPLATTSMAPSAA